MATRKPLCWLCWYQTPAALQQHILLAQRRVLNAQTASAAGAEVSALDDYDSFVKGAVDLLRK